MLKKITLKILAVYFFKINIVQAAESGGMPQLDPEFWVSQIFWLIITFGILYLVLSKLILPKISDNLETRKSQVLDNLELAEKQRNDSEAKLKEFENIILKSKTEAKNLFNESRKKLLEDINKKRYCYPECCIKSHYILFLLAMSLTIAVILLLLIFAPIN